MSTLMLLRLLTLLLALGATVASAALPPAWRGHWEGAVTFRGDTWPIRLALPEAANATLDLPELWMAWEPVSVEAAEDTATVELPFGLGAVPLGACGAGLCGSRTIGDDVLAITLQRATPLAATRREVVLQSGKATLHGTFRAPPGEALPAVVLVHGATNRTRDAWNYRSAADHWLRRGHAVLLYDKRGSGASTGTWMTTSFPDLAELGADLRVALDWVARQPQVDAARVGVHGGSEALWTTAIATELGATPAFAVISGAPATTPLVQERERVLLRVEAADLPAADREAARRHVALYFEAAADPAGSAEAIASSAAAEGAPWKDLVPHARTDDDFYWWRHNHDVDPAPMLRDWNFPVLLLHGGADADVVPTTHLPRMRALIDPGVLTIRTFPGAAHNLELPGGRDAAGQWRFPRKPPGLAAAIDAWREGAMLATP